MIKKVTNGRRGILTAFLVALIIGAASISWAQGAPTQSQGGAKDHSDVMQLGPSQIFGDFKKGLEDFLKNGKHRTPDQEAYHFVVLLNTANTDGVAAHEMRRIYHDLLFYYCTDADAGKDRISFAPFQLDVRGDYARWNQPFTAKTAQELYNRFPDSPETRPGLKGGNDVEGSLLEAANKIRNEYPDDMSGSIFIVLSDSEVSQQPLLPNGATAMSYTLTKDVRGFSEKLERAGLDPNALRGQATETRKNADGSNTDIVVYWRIYTPVDFKCLVKADTVIRGKPTVIPSPTPSTTPAVQNVNTQPVKQPEPKGPAIEDVLIYGGIALALVGGLIAYIVWLFKPRRLRIGYRTASEMTFNFAHTFDLKFGRPIGISAKSTDESIGIPGIPENITAAKLSISWLGSIVLASEAWQVTDSPVSIGADPVDVNLSPSAGPLMPGVDQLILHIERADA